MRYNQRKRQVEKIDKGYEKSLFKESYDRKIMEERFRPTSLVTERKICISIATNFNVLPIVY